MIVIRDLSEIEKYKSMEAEIVDDYIYKDYLYEFKEGNEYADVIFDVYVPFGIDDVTEESDYLPRYYFCANSFTFNIGGGCHSIACNSLKSGDCLLVENTNVYGDVDVQTLCAEKVVANNVNCSEDLMVNISMECGHLSVKEECVLGRFKFKSGIDTYVQKNFYRRREENLVTASGFLPF